MTPSPTGLAALFSLETAPYPLRLRHVSAAADCVLLPLDLSDDRLVSIVLVRWMNAVLASIR
jgi:hypothetical protein